MKSKFLSLVFRVLHDLVTADLPTLSTINPFFNETGFLTVSQTILPLFLLVPLLEYIPSLLNLFKFYPFPNTQFRSHLLEAWPELSKLKSSFFWILRTLLFGSVTSNLFENETLCLTPKYFRTQMTVYFQSIDWESNDDKNLLWIFRMKICILISVIDCLHVNNYIHIYYFLILQTNPFAQKNFLTFSTSSVTVRDLQATDWKILAFIIWHIMIF